MLKDSTPDKTADYFEEVELINTYLSKANNHKMSLRITKPVFEGIDKQIKDLMKKYSSGPQDFDSLQNVINDLNKCKSEIEEKIMSAYTIQDDVHDIQKQLGDYWIAVNIAHRGDEIQNLQEKLDVLHDDFNEIKKADDDFEGDAKSEASIKKMVSGLSAKLKALQDEASGHQ